MTGRWISRVSSCSYADNLDRENGWSRLVVATDIRTGHRGNTTDTWDDRESRRQSPVERSDRGEVSCSMRSGRQESVASLAVNKQEKVGTRERWL